MDSFKTIKCPSCSAPLDIKGLGRTSTFGCSYCGAVLDIESEDLKIVSEAKKLISKLKIPLGKRGVFEGVTFELIGHILRTDNFNEFYWSEYLLFNPYHGFRWLSEYNNHWQFVTPLPYVPDFLSTGKYNGHHYRLFNQGISKIYEIVGELYWEAKRGDKAYATDYVSPPLGLSYESSDDEITVSEFYYMPVEEIEKAFNLINKQDRLGGSVGVSLTQPNPHKKSFYAEMLLYGVLLLLLFVFQMKSVSTSLNTTLLSQTFSIVKSDSIDALSDTAGDEAKDIFISPLRVTSKASNIEVKVNADVSNSWLYAELSLSSMDGQFKDEKDIEVSFYFGQDSDGSWYEGSKSNTILFSSVPPGEYQLIVSPLIPKDGAYNSSYPKSFKLTVTQDVPYWGNFIVAFLVLLILPAWKLIRYFNFESRRWAESSISY